MAAPLQTREALARHARSRLANFKVPRYWTFVDSFPRTASERVERRHLVAGLEPGPVVYDRVEGILGRKSFPHRQSPDNHYGRWHLMHQFINGRRCVGSSPTALDNVNPATGEVIETLDLASADDVDAAVRAARAAQRGWAETPPSARAELVYRVATYIQEHLKEFAAVESRESGKPIRLASEGDLPGVVDTGMFFAGAARHLEGKAAAEYSGDHTSYVRRDPVGVVGAITPWNFPMLMAAWKAFPIIAAGNSLVLKPSEMTPGTTLMLAQAFADAGLPPGVFNVVVGTGVEAGDALSSHPDVDMVCFTGSTGVGRNVMQAASQRNARVHLELGGKAPFVVHDDADLEAACHGAVAGALSNVGQDCTAATRAYVHRSRYDEFVTRVAELMEGVRLGRTDDPGNRSRSVGVPASAGDRLGGRRPGARRRRDRGDRWRGAGR